MNNLQFKALKKLRSHLVKSLDENGKNKDGVDLFDELSALEEILDEYYKSTKEYTDQLFMAHDAVAAADDC